MVIVMFVETFTYCRNRKCRSKLPEKAESQRKAFCCRGCFVQFYRYHCLVCETDLLKPGLVDAIKPQRNFCGQRCKRVFQQNRALYEPTKLFPVSTIGKEREALRKANKIGPFIAGQIKVPVNLVGGWKFHDEGPIDAELVANVLATEGQARWPTHNP